MTDDERAIRQVVETWMEATKTGDTATVLNLMTDDVVFTGPGQEPFGKAAFAAASKGMAGARFEGSSEILELQLMGAWAFIRNRIEITVTPVTNRPTVCLRVRGSIDIRETLATIPGATPNYQLPTSNHPQFPIPDSQQRSIGSWELGMAGTWALGLGSCRGEACLAPTSWSSSWRSR